MVDRKVGDSKAAALVGKMADTSAGTLDNRASASALALVVAALDYKAALVALNTRRCGELFVLLARSLCF